MDTLLLTARLDDRIGQGTNGKGRIGSRIGLQADAEMFDKSTDIFALAKRLSQASEIACIMVDEAQFLTVAQVWQLSAIADELSIPVMCYGLRTDFQGQLFDGSATLLAIADVLREIHTICHCGRKATMVVRLDADGTPIADGAQIEIGGNDKYVSLCRKHWKEAMKIAPMLDDS